MREEFQAYVDLSFQGRLRRRSELFKVEIFFFIEQLKQHGITMIGVPGYTVAVLTNKPHSLGRAEFLLKALGVWTRLWLEEREPGVFVLYDRSG